MRRPTSRIVAGVRYALTTHTRFTTRLEPWAIIATAPDNHTFGAGNLIERFRTKRDALDTLDQITEPTLKRANSSMATEDNEV